MNFLASVAAYFSGGTRESKPIEHNPCPASGLGSVGHGQLSRTFRIMFVNGCSYEEEETWTAAKRISELFQKCTGKETEVYYTHAPITAREVVSYVRWNIDPPGGKLLLKNIRRQLKHLRAQKDDALGEPKNIGRLALVLHSGAGALLSSIKERLTPKERKKIDVISFGSSCMFKKEDFHKALNFVAYWDPIPRLAQLVASPWQSPEEILPAGSIWQVPVVVHTFLRPPYQEALGQVVRAYVQENTLSAAYGVTR